MLGWTSRRNGRRDNDSVEKFGLRVMSLAAGRAGQAIVWVGPPRFQGHKPAWAGHVVTGLPGYRSSARKRRPFHYGSAFHPHAHGPDGHDTPGCVLSDVRRSIELFRKSTSALSGWSRTVFFFCATTRIRTRIRPGGGSKYREFGLPLLGWIAIDLEIGRVVTPIRSWFRRRTPRLVGTSS